MEDKGTAALKSCADAIVVGGGTGSEDKRGGGGAAPAAGAAACHRVKMVSSGCNMTMATAPDIQPAHTSTSHSLLLFQKDDVSAMLMNEKFWRIVGILGPG
jgi:hypothetical protein